MEDDLYAPDPQRWITLGRRLGWMLAALFLFFGGLYLLKVGGQFTPAPLRLADVRLDPSPPYSLEAFMKEVQALGNLPATLPASDGPQFLPLASALARHPWIASVDEFRHLRVDLVEIAVHYRTPIYQIEQAGERFFVSDDRVVLNFVESLRERPIVLKGVRIQGRLKAGQRLSGSEIEAAARAVAALQSSWKSWKISCLELASDPVQPTLRIISSGGSAIVWRSLNSQEQEVSDQEKVERLRQYLTQFGSFEKPNGPYLLDVRPMSGLQRQNLK